MNVHFNHPDEMTPAAVAALDRLSKAGGIDGLPDCAAQGM